MKICSFKMLSSALLLAALASQVGCAATYDRTEITEVSQGSLPGAVSLNQVTVAEGALVTARVIPYNSDGHPIEGTILSDNPKVLECVRATDNKWAFLGVTPGKTTVVFLADGQVVGRATAEVTGQP